MSLVVDDQRWRNHAECRDMDTDLFYPRRGQNPREARAACARCPVQPQCLEYGLVMQTAEDDCGVWGNTTPQDRRGMRRWLQS